VTVHPFFIFCFFCSDFFARAQRTRSISLSYPPLPFFFFFFFSLPPPIGKLLTFFSEVGGESLPLFFPVFPPFHCFPFFEILRLVVENLRIVPETIVPLFPPPFFFFLCSLLHDEVIYNACQRTACLLSFFFSFLPFFFLFSPSFFSLLVGLGHFPLQGRTERRRSLDEVISLLFPFSFFFSLPSSPVRKMCEAFSPP